VVRVAEQIEVEVVAPALGGEAEEAIGNEKKKGKEGTEATRL
jgi:hypothetical protein